MILLVIWNLNCCNIGYGLISWSLDLLNSCLILSRQLNGTLYPFIFLAEDKKHLQNVKSAKIKTTVTLDSGAPEQMYLIPLGYFEATIKRFIFSL